MSFTLNPFRSSSSAKHKHPPAPAPADPDPPPAYAPPSSSSTNNPTPRVAAPHGLSRASSSSRYAALSAFDTVFLIDDSGSMTGSNWTQTSKALSTIVPICTEFDADGIDIYFLNSSKKSLGTKSSSEVLALFSSIRPAGSTPTGRKLGELLEVYLKAYKKDSRTKPLNIIVITDGEPTDPHKLETAIVETARELDKLGAPGEQVGVQFFQVGTDGGATEALEELDNSLVEEWGVRDMVDTVSWKRLEAAAAGTGEGLSGEAILKVVMGAVDRKLDRRRK